MVRTAGDATSTAALDASVLINFLHLERLDILADIAEVDFVVPEQVVEEITVPQQRQTLNAAIRSRQLRSERSTVPDELASYAYLRRFMGRGEAIRAGLVSVDEADVLKARLETHRYRMRFDSFRDVLDPDRIGARGER